MQDRKPYNEHARTHRLPPRLPAPCTSSILLCSSSMRSMIQAIAALSLLLRSTCSAALKAQSTGKPMPMRLSTRVYA